MSDPSPGPDIHHEPHLRPGELIPDSSDRRISHRLAHEAQQSSYADRVDHSVWDEPSLSTNLSGEPGPDQLTYSRWLDQSEQRTSWWKSWLMVLCVALAAGPWGILGAVVQGAHGRFALLTLVIFGPVTEEVSKITVALWVVEKRPFWFRSMWQIFLCAAIGGWVFAAVENLIYLHVYFPDPTSTLVRWRWTACIGLHVNCSIVAGVGLVRIWDDAIRKQHRPRLWLGVPWFVTAMVGHGIYNATVVIAETVGWLDFLGTVGK